MNKHPRRRLLCLFGLLLFFMLLACTGDGGGNGNGNDNDNDNTTSVVIDTDNTISNDNIQIVVTAEGTNGNDNATLNEPVPTCIPPPQETPSGLAESGEANICSSH